MDPLELSEASSLIMQIRKLRPRGKRWLVQGYTVSQRLEASHSYSLQGFRDIKKQGSLSGAAGEPLDRPRPACYAVTSSWEVAAGGLHTKPGLA